MSRSALDIFKKVFPYLYFKATNARQRGENLMGVSVSSTSNGEFMAGAPRWWKDTNVVYYRGRVSVFKKDNTVSYGTIPCEDGKLKNEFNFDLGKCATLAPSII